jgi:hypothetical protein
MIEFVQFFGKAFVALALAGLVGLIVALLVLSVLLVIVNLFQLNYRGNSYWVLNVSLVFWLVSWVLSFGYLISLK